MNNAILNTAIFRKLRAAKFTPSMGTSRYGTPEPQVEIRFPKGYHHRQTSAATHALIAIIELATPHEERWVVATDTHANEVGRVYLELMDGDEREARRGLELLTRVIG